MTGKRPGTAVSPVWRRRTIQTSQHFHVFHDLDDDQAGTCDLPTPSMMKKTGTYDHPMTCNDGDENEWKTLKAGHPSPSKRHGSTPDHPSNQPASWSWTLPMTRAGPAPHSLNVHCPVWKNDGTLESHAVCRTREIVDCAPHSVTCGVPTPWSQKHRRTSAVPPWTRWKTQTS